MAIIFAISAVQALRILAQPGPGTPLLWASLALSGLPGLLCLLSLFLLFPKGASLLKKVSGSNSLLFGIVLSAWVLAVSCLDLAAARGPEVLLAGSMAIGLLFWNRPAILGLLALLPDLAYIALAVLAARASAGVLATAGLAALTAALAALLVRRSTAPSQERLKSLEAENKELWNLSFRDGLTGLYNRRFAQETGATMFTRAQRYHEQLHVLMIDIDHFKKVNDKLGHPVGDIVLRDVAEVIKANVRSSDMAARYGGEEFIIFLVRAEPELVQFVANRIRDGIAAHSFENVPWKVTVSIGVASIQPNDSLEELVDRSDKFLYLSKHSGRNRVSGS